MFNDKQKTLGVSGKLILLSALMFWLYRNNLNMLNNLILLILIIGVISSLMMRTRLFTKNENRRFRRTKVVSLLIAIIMIIIILGATIVFNFVDEIGADSKQYDSPHYHDGTFHNLNETSVSTGNFFEALVDFLVFDPSRTPNSVIPTEKFEIQNLEEDEVSITWFGHSTILIQSQQYKILIDPLFGDVSMGPLFLGPAPFDYENTYEVEDLPPIDVVLISHDHYDHLDMRTVVEFEDSTFLVPLGVKPHLELWDIPSENIEEFDWYEGIKISDELEIILTPSQHFSGRGLTSDLTLWGSWLIKLHGSSIFFGGDGGYSAEFKTIGDMYGPFDIAILEAGQYHEAWSDIHMLPDEVVQAGIDLNSNSVLPIHNSKYELALHPWNEPLIEVTAEGERKNYTITTPMIGQSFILGQESPNDHWWTRVSSGEEAFLKTNFWVGFIMLPTMMVLGIALIRYSNNLSNSEEE